MAPIDLVIAAHHVSCSSSDGLSKAPHIKLVCCLIIDVAVDGQVWWVAEEWTAVRFLLITNPIYKRWVN